MVRRGPTRGRPLHRARPGLRCVIAAAACTTVLLSAQGTPPPQPTFHTEANYVRVDVYPTLNGAPVTDLRQDEFELLDNGVAQRIEQFEQVRILPAGPQETRVEPNTVRESRAMVEESRARLFVLFLDLYHVDVGGSHDIRAPLIKALDSMIGPDDLVGVMTPEMSAADLAFARKTTTIAGLLTRHWTWGERDQLNSPDPQDTQYYACYPGQTSMPCGDGSIDTDAGIAAEMIARRHEKVTLDALEDLVRHLRGVREERKAVLVISDGWRLFRPNPALDRRLDCAAPVGPTVYIDPHTGKPTTKNTANPTETTPSECERDRMALAAIDDDQQFRYMLDEANRSNASFYPIDPRGLEAFDTSIAPPNGPAFGVPAPVTPPSIDQVMLRERLTSLRTLAEATDGLAIVQSNDLTGGLQRVVNDLTSYYLLGYYTTARLDGKFHAITVRVKRPGVRVRARRGYLAPTPAEVARAASAPRPPAEAGAAAERHAIESIVAPLAGYERPVPLRLQTASAAGRIWVTGEVGETEVRGAWRSGGRIDLLLTSAAGETVGDAHATIAPGGRAFEATMMAPGPGAFDVRVRARPTTLDAEALNEVVRTEVGSTPSGARFVRRGPASANRDAPAADLRFRRNETLRVEWPTGAQPGSGQARLLDRTGKPLAVPVSAATRPSDGVVWETAQLALAPLAPGDYVVELVSGSDRRLAAFKVVP